ncbi:membrane protein YczE [Thalassiella azotivora]
MRGRRPGPAPAGRRLPRRLVQLYLGLVAFGASMAMIVRSDLGNIPWDVLHQGVARSTGLSFGTVTVLVAVAVLALWLPLRERPGLGTVSNAFVIGPVVDVALAVVPTGLPLGWRVGLFVAGVLLNALATAAYIGARFGPGPRDGLMTGLVARTGGSVRLVRTGIEVVVVIVGWALGGTFGAGTVLFALAIGPLVHELLPRFEVPLGRSPRRGDEPGAAPPAVAPG